MERTFTFDKIPTSVAEVKANIQDPFEAVAVASIVLCNYKNDVATTINMINVLKGPQPLSPFEIQFLRDRLGGKEYKPFSYFAGSSPENGYTPTMPYTITVSDNPYSYQDDAYANLYVKSSGADSPRSIKVRKKPSTGQWFLWEYFTLADIRIPVEQDPWA